MYIFHVNHHHHHHPASYVDSTRSMS